MYAKQRWAKEEEEEWKDSRCRDDKTYAVDVLDEVIAQLVVDLCRLLTIRTLLDIVLQGGMATKISIISAMARQH